MFRATCTLICIISKKNKHYLRSGSVISKRSREKTQFSQYNANLDYLWNKNMHFLWKKYFITTHLWTLKQMIVFKISLFFSKLSRGRVCEQRAEAQVSDSKRWVRNRPCGKCFQQSVSRRWISIQYGKLVVRRSYRVNNNRDGRTMDARSNSARNVTARIINTRHALRFISSRIWVMSASTT